MKVDATRTQNDPGYDFQLFLLYPAPLTSLHQENRKPGECRSGDIPFGKFYRDYPISAGLINSLPSGNLSISVFSNVTV